MEKRCYCCGTNDIRVGLVCFTCKRDAQFNEEFAARVRRAEAGEPQVCLKCGWDKACICNR